MKQYKCGNQEEIDEVVFVECTINMDVKYNLWEGELDTGLRFLKCGCAEYFICFYFFNAGAFIQSH